MNIKNYCHFQGRLVADPIEMKGSTEENRKASIKIAVDRGLSSKARKEAEAKKYPTADFVALMINGKTAETVLEYYKKGHIVDAMAHYTTWTTKNQDGSTDYKDGFIVDVISWTTHNAENGEGNKGNDNNNNNKNQKAAPAKSNKKDDSDYYGSPDEEYVPF